MKKLTHNGFYYDFDYDEIGNNTASYTYDEYGNVTNVAVNGADRYQSYANKLGNITKHEDLLNKQLYNYEFDINGRLVRQSVEDTSKAIGNERNLYLLEYSYDNMDNISGFINKVGKKALKHSYVYTADNLLNTYTMPTEKTVSYTYDGLNRLKQYQVNTATPLTVAYEYEASKRNTDGKSTYQTTKVSQETVGNKGTSYTYDKVGNITGIKEKNPSGTYELTNSYQYDELDQLVREDDLNQGKTKVYTYDLGGNIISINEYGYTRPEEEPSNLLNTVAYEYSDTNWKDKLTSYNGQPITYDEIGNPTSYNGYTFGWDNGRELSSLSGNGVTASYTYDADGLRATKTVNGVKTTYEYVDGQLIYEKKGNTELHYFYDTNGSLKGNQTVDSAGTAISYYVITNTRGDVTQIYDSLGSLKVLYTYDSWGKVLSITDGNGNEITSSTNIGKLNSFRYRSYYYDDETGLFYVGSRYYNPEWGRFLNADGIVDTGLGLNGTNMFAYCENNPIMYNDPSGYNSIYAEKGWLRDVDGPYPYGDLIYYIIAGGSYVYTKLPKAYNVTFNGKSSYGNVSGSTAVPCPMPPNPNGNKKGNSKSNKLTKQQMNKYKSEVQSNNDVHFKTKEQALEFIKNKFPNFKQEVAGSRSSEGWHFDSHPINGSPKPIQHINIYSKPGGFRVHITWG